MNEGRARLIVKLGPNPEKEYILSQPEITIGRSPGNSIVVPNPEVSRRHARIRRVNAAYEIEDWGSTNGTFISGKRVMHKTILHHGDEIQLGDSIAFVFYNEPELPPITQPIPVKPDQELTVVESYPSIPPSPEISPKVEEPPQLNQEVDPNEFILPEVSDNTNRNRLRLIGCGCLIFFIPLLCLGIIIFLDFYQQGRFLYCGSLRPMFEILLGPLGFAPLCP